MIKATCSILLIWMICFGMPHRIHAQTKIDTINLKKGEVFDILILTQHPNTQADLQSYFKTAFPVANRMSYKSLPGFKIVGHTQGNHQASSLILGKWSDITKREQFLTQIVEEVPDFHERRRKIWSYFGLSYFEIQQDLSLQIDRAKYHVATAYWLQPNSDSSKFYNMWIKSIQKNNGRILVQLSEGTSPFGYRYDPDYFVITVWESEEAFTAFQKELQGMELDNIQHVNEFLLK